MTDFSYTMETPDTQLPNLGLLVLQSDETIEHDFQHLISPDVARLMVSRVSSCLEVSNESLGEMVDTIPSAAALFPRHLKLDAVGYGCTSASSVIGETKVAQLASSECDCAYVTNPMSALVAVCNHLNIKNLAFLSPYVQEVSDTLRSTLKNSGVNSPVFGSFNEAVEHRVTRIDNRSIIEAGIQLGKNEQTEALFLSCTNLKTLEVIEEIEEKISKPVLSSNLVLAWHMCMLAGINPRQKNVGQLFAN